MPLRWRPPRFPVDRRSRSRRRPVRRGTPRGGGHLGRPGHLLLPRREGGGGATFAPPLPTTRWKSAVWTSRPPEAPSSGPATPAPSPRTHRRWMATSCRGARSTTVIRSSTSRAPPQDRAPGRLCSLVGDTRRNRNSRGASVPDRVPSGTGRQRSPRGGLRLAGVADPGRRYSDRHPDPPKGPTWQLARGSAEPVLGWYLPPSARSALRRLWSVRESAADSTGSSQPSSSRPRLSGSAPAFAGRPTNSLPGPGPLSGLRAGCTTVW